MQADGWMDRKIDGWMDLGRWVGRWVGEKEREVYLMIWLISVVLTAQQSSDKPLISSKHLSTSPYCLNNLDHEIRKSNYTKAKTIYFFIFSFLKSHNFFKYFPPFDGACAFLQENN